MQLLMLVTCFQSAWVRNRCCGTAGAFCFSPRAESQANDNNKETVWALILPLASCYLILVTTVAFSTGAGTTQGARLYLTENPGYVRASEQQVTLTHAPGLEAALLTAFSARDGPAAFGTKGTAVEEGCCLSL